MGIQGCGVWCLEWRRFAAKNRSVTLAGVRIFQVIFQFVRIRRVTGRWNTAGRSPLIRLRYHPNTFRLKVPRDCQSPVSTAVIDDDDLFGAGLANRRVDSSADPVLGVVGGNQD